MSDNKPINAVITEVTFFTGDDPYSDQAVEVTWRGGDLYAVKRGAFVWNGSDWEFEPIPSLRDDGFISRTRFGYDRACSIATEVLSREAPAR